MPSKPKAIVIWAGTVQDRYELDGASFQFAEEGVMVQKGKRTFLYPWFSITKVAIEA